MCFLHAGILVCLGSVFSGAAWTVVSGMLLQMGEEPLDSLSVLFCSSPTCIATTCAAASLRRLIGAAAPLTSNGPSYCTPLRTLFGSRLTSGVTMSRCQALICVVPRSASSRRVDGRRVETQRAKHSQTGRHCLSTPGHPACAAHMLLYRPH